MAQAVWPLTAAEIRGNHSSRPLVGAAARWCSSRSRRSSSTRRGRRSRATTTTTGPYLSPFYSPELFGDSPHAWFGPKPAWWPGALPFSPALLILLGAGRLPLHLLLLPRRLLQGVLGRPAVVRRRRAAQDVSGRAIVSAHPAEHPPLLPLPRACSSSCILTVDAMKAFWFTDPRPAPTHFGIGVGTLRADASTRSCSAATPSAATRCATSSAAASTRSRRRRCAASCYSCVSLPEPPAHALGVVQPVLGRLRRPLRAAVLDGRLDGLADPVMSPSTLL